MDLTTDIVFGADYYGNEVNELAVASFNYVKQDIADVKRRYISLGFHLHEMEMCRYHEELGYDNFYECIEKNFHMDKSAISRVISVWKEFCSKDGDSRKMWIDDRYEKYSYSQLVEMLPLKENERFKVNADMTVSQIRNYKKSLKEKAKEQKTKDNTSPKDSVATSQSVPEEKEEPVITQPELPVMKNMTQREDFINSYKSWNIWCKNECTEETFYRYDLPDGYAIVVKNYPYYIEWDKKECETEEYYLLSPRYHHFAECGTNMTQLKEYLKNMNKK